MNNNLLELIKGLSLADTKTLSQKALKLSEESGELSSKVLALENADGSRHKVFYKQDILEECADAILVALSIAYSLGYDSDSIDSMMQDKAYYWSSLRELDTSDGKYPYEIHLTIESALDEFDYDRFYSHCKEKGVKPIILDLEGQEQITTSTIVYGTVNDASTATDELTDWFELKENEGGAYLYDVVRRKIETVPWHPMTRSFDPNKYYETHFTFVVPEDEVDHVRYYCGQYGVHVSKNALKYDVDGMKKFMGTVRDYTNREQHETRVSKILNYLKNNRIEPVKHITEYAFFDSNKQLDDKWMKINV